MGTIRGALARVRQWTFPPAFRVPAAPADDTAELLAALALVLRPADPPPAPPTPAPATPLEAPPPANPVELGNVLFRLRRAAAQLAARGTDSRELRNLDRTVRDFGDLLDEHGVACLDLTDQPFDAGDARFEPAGSEVVPGLARPTIVYCERPAVLARGRLLQPARGMVGLPPEPVSPRGTAP